MSVCTWGSLWVKYSSVPCRLRAGILQLLQLGQKLFQDVTPDFHQVDLNPPLGGKPHYDQPVGTSGIAGNGTHKCIHLALDEAVKVLCGSILFCKVKVHQCPALLLHVDDTEEDLGVGFEQRDEVEHAIPVSSAAERGTREQQELSKVDVAVMSK